MAAKMVVLTVVYLVVEKVAKKVVRLASVMADRKAVEWAAKKAAGTGPYLADQSVISTVWR